MNISNAFIKLKEAQHPAGGKLFSYGAAYPTITAKGYAKGCIHLNTSATSEDDALYVNIGTAASCNFVATSSVLGQIELAQGNVIIGGADGQGAALVASGDKKFLIGNGTTAAMYAITGDVTTTNQGVASVIVNNFTAATDALAVDDKVAVTDTSATNATKAITGQKFFDGAGNLAADTVASGSQVMILNTNVAKQESIDDIATLLSGDGLTATSAVIALDVNSLATAATDALAVADKLSCSDATDANATKSITGQLLFNGAGNLAADNVATGSVLMLLNSGVAKTETIDDVATFMAGDGLAAASGVLAVDANELTGAVIDVSADSIPFVDATDNSTKKEAVADLATAMAGTNLTATAGVLSIAALTGLTSVSIAGTTTALSFTGTYTGNVIDLSGATIDPTGSAGPCFIRLGTYDAPFDYGADNDQSGVVRLYTTCSGDISSYDRGLFVCTETTGAKGAFPVSGLAEANNTGTGPKSLGAAQFIAHLGARSEGAVLTTLGADAEILCGMYGLWAKVASPVLSTCDAGSRVAPIWCDNQMSGTVSGDEFGIFATTGASKPDAFIGFGTKSSGYDQFFSFDTSFNAGAGTCVTTDAVPANAQDARILVHYDGLQYYIPLWR